MQFTIEQPVPKKLKFRDYSHFNEQNFISDLLLVDWSIILTKHSANPKKAFSSFYNKLDKLVNKHAPFKSLSKRKVRQFSKPWLSKGLIKSIKVKNALLVSGDLEKYRFYRNILSGLIRQSKRLHYFNFFNENLYNMKNTWAGTNQLLNRRKNNSKHITVLKRPGTGETTILGSELPNIMSNYFSSIGESLAKNVPSSTKHFSEYLHEHSLVNSFFFDPVTQPEIEREILSLPYNKAYGLYSCPIRPLK